MTLKCLFTFVNIQSIFIYSFTQSKLARSLARARAPPPAAPPPPCAFTPRLSFGRALLLLQQCESGPRAESSFSLREWSRNEAPAVFKCLFCIYLIHFVLLKTEGTDTRVVGTGVGMKWLSPCLQVRTFHS